MSTPKRTVHFSWNAKLPNGTMKIVKKKYISRRNLCGSGEEIDPFPKE